MRWLKRVIAITLVLILMPTGLLFIYVKAAEFYTEQFYAGRPILARMSEVWPRRFQKDPVAVREAFLREVPLGTGKQSLVNQLLPEGFSCVPNSIRGEGWTQCMLGAPSRGFGYTNWILDFQFDAENRLTDVRIVIQPIFL